jgi:hypothetical protein
VQYSASVTCQVSDHILEGPIGLTSTVSVDAIDDSIITHLVQAFVARPAESVVASMPASTYFVSDFPLLLVWTDCDDGADDFVAWDSREACPVGTVSVAVSTSQVYATYIGPKAPC